MKQSNSYQKNKILILISVQLSSPLYIFKFIFHIYIVRFNEIINKNNLA